MFLCLTIVAGSTGQSVWQVCCHFREVPVYRVSVLQMILHAWCLSCLNRSFWTLEREDASEGRTTLSLEKGIKCRGSTWVRCTIIIMSSAKKCLRTAGKTRPNDEVFLEGRLRVVEHHFLKQNLSVSLLVDCYISVLPPFGCSKGFSKSVDRVSYLLRFGRTVWPPSCCAVFRPKWRWPRCCCLELKLWSALNGSKRKSPKATVFLFENIQVEPMFPSWATL